MENLIALNDETLPSFNYLDELSKVTKDDVSSTIKDWNKKYEENNILQAEVESE